MPIKLYLKNLSLNQTPQEIKKKAVCVLCLPCASNDDAQRTMEYFQKTLQSTSLDDFFISEQFREKEAVFRMSDNDNVSSERSYIFRKKMRTYEEILHDLNAEIDISDGEYESDWSVGVDKDTDDEIDYSSQSNTDNAGEDRLFVGFNLSEMCFNEA